MKRGHTDVQLAHPWFVGEGVFAASKPGETQYLDVLDLLPADAKEARAAVTYARDGTDAVTLAGASLVFEGTEEFTTDRMLSAPTVSRGPGLLWAAEAELRKTPAVLRGIVRDLRQLAQSRRVPLSAVSGAFAAGAVMAMLAGWVF